MNKHQCFAAWAPADSIWSVWAKPVLFAYMTEIGQASEPTPPIPLAEIFPPPALSPPTAIFLDLPGADAVPIALAWATAGYRPVPVYNSAPAQGGLPTGLPTNEVVEVRPILYALKAAAPALATIQLPADAPPVFLLDSRRRIGASPAQPGAFDYRSISLPTDFPSAKFLISYGIKTILLIGTHSLYPQADLAHTLLRYQQSGIEIVSKIIDSMQDPIPIQIPKPTWFRCMFQRALAVVGFRRNVLGGFGGTLPEPSTG